MDDVGNVIGTSSPQRYKGVPGWFSFQLRHQRLSQLLALPLAAVLFLLVLPIASLLQYSLYTFVPGKGVLFQLTLANYTSFLSDEFYLSSIAVTLGTAGLVAIVTVAVAYPVAYFYARSAFRYKGLLMTMLLAPFYLNILVKTFAWMVILGREGPINRMLVQLPFVDRPYDFLQGYLGIVIILVYLSIPYAAILMIGPLQNIDASVLSSARICGSGTLEVFRRVILPLSIPGIISSSILVFAMNVTSFVTPILVGGSWGYKFLGVIAYQSITTYSNWAFGSAVATVMLVLSSVIVVVYSIVVKLTRFGVVMSEKFVR